MDIVKEGEGGRERESERKKRERERDETSPPWCPTGRERKTNRETDTHTEKQTDGARER